MDYLENLDFYEVEKQDYKAYVYRLKDREKYEMKLEDGLTIAFDKELDIPLYGTKKEHLSLLGQDGVQFYIFEFLDEELLGPHLVTKYINLSAEDWQNFLDTFSQVHGGDK